MEKIPTGESYVALKNYLDEELGEKRIDQTYYDLALENVVPRLRYWLGDRHIKRTSPITEHGIRDAISRKRWKEIAETFMQDVTFGTAGIRAKMGFDRASILRLKQDGVDARILRGPNTFNNIVLLLISTAVAKYGREKGLSKLVVGYDSRIQGAAFGRLVAESFLGYGYTVYLFDEACPFPEAVFAITDLHADIGIMISASHNDYRYNGFKLCCQNGSQFDLKERNYIYDHYIREVQTGQIHLLNLSSASKGRLRFLGGDKPRKDFDYLGKHNYLIDMHKRHIDHVKKFLLRKELIEGQKHSQRAVCIGYSAFHGAGRRAVPRILEEIGFDLARIKRISRMDELNGMFPCFGSDPGKEQQPDPGDPRSADIAVELFKKEYPKDYEDLDILIGTDPDADRCGVIIKVPQEQQHLYEGKDYMLLPADDAWALVLWYRLNWEIETYGSIQDREKKFIVQSHTTCDSLVRLAKKYGLGVIKTWVGFATLARGVEMVWNHEPIPNLNEGRVRPEDPMCHPTLYESQDMSNTERSINFAAMEQSNGFSILGAAPKDRSSLGKNGHIRDKDGTFAALLSAEMAAYAKERNTTLYELLDEKIFLDPDIGLFINYYEPAPTDGEYEGLEGYSLKKNILMRGIDLHQTARRGDVVLGATSVLSSCIYLTGKYDDQNWPGFPDEGIRFYFDEQRLNYLTIRPSGTSNALRFHAQLHAKDVNRQNLVEKKSDLQRRAKTIVAEVRQVLGATA